MPNFTGLWTLRQQFKATGQGIWAAAPGQQAYTTPGTYAWIAPQGVTSVCVVCVGAGGCYPGNIDGGGGGGGALAYANNITVVPGTSYTVVVGDRVTGAGNRGGFSSFNSTSVKANGGVNGAVGGGGGAGGDVVYGTGGLGGNGDTATDGGPGPGGGAGGYSGNGGGINSSGNGGAGGGGGGGNASYGGGGGGGVGLLGEGSNGAGGVVSNGGGGSGGTSSATYGNGGNYGGGAATASPGTGAVRIIWGDGRAFPSTNTGDV